MTESKSDHSIYFISLGCDKNGVDSEVMLGLLSRGGYELTDDIDSADTVIVNTCCFIGDAKEESINTILDVAELKNEGKIKALVVTGCLSERYREEVRKEIPEVDVLLGTASIGHIKEVLDGIYGYSDAGKDDGAKTACDDHGDVASTAPYDVFDPLNTPPFQSDARLHPSVLIHHAYLKIAEGCDKHCTYCIIPSLRGPYRSYPMEYLVDEAKRLADEGVSELILVAQETTLYGTDLYGKRCLHSLLQKLGEIDGIHWIRVLYCYPEEIYDELIEEIATNPKVCHYLDMPIQHASDDILRRMGRHTTEDELDAIIDKLRKRIPDIALRTTLISGFPGETQEDHEELYRFVDAAEFDRLGVFAYSQEEDTPAAQFEGQIDEEVKKERLEELMVLQQEICFENAPKHIGEVVEVLIEGLLAEENVYIGRTYRDAPDVDGRVFMEVDRERMSGEYVYVRITDVQDYDLIGEITDEPAQ